jgi:uncharacterized protein (TIGR03435 family)
LPLVVLLCSTTGCVWHDRPAVRREYRVQAVDIDGVRAVGRIGPPSAVGGSYTRGVGDDLEMWAGQTTLDWYLPLAFGTFGISSERLLVEAPLPEERFECSVRGGSKAACEKAFCEALRRCFGLNARREIRTLDVYVLTAPFGEIRINPRKPDDPKRQNKAGESWFSLKRATTSQFCRMLEWLLESPVVDESNLDGEYEFSMDIPQTDSGPMPVDAGALVSSVYERFGLRLTPARREVQVVVVGWDAATPDQ